MCGFHKFEQIMKYRNFNYERYCSLKNAVEHKNKKSKGLVIYFGAGSSLYSNRWGDPFEKVYKDLAEKINNAIQYNQKEIERNRNEKNAASNLEKIKKLEEQYQKLEKDRKTFEEIKAEVDNVGYMLDENEPDYLGIGNILDRNIKKFEPTDIARQYGVNNYQSFNHACCDILDDKNKRKTVEDYNFEGYVTKHLFYVAYLFKELGVGLTTVNVDTCFSDVCKKLGHTLPTATMYVPEANKVRIQFPCNEYAIVHIHGCIKSNGRLTPEFLVMTRDDYNRTYPDINSVADCVSNTQRMLFDISQNYDVLFLGTSLSVDTPIALLKNHAAIFNERKAKNLQYIPFIGGQATPKGDFIKHTTPIVFEDFDDYAVVLHMLLRETAPNIFKNCRWNQNIKELYEKNQDLEALTDDQKKGIDNFLNIQEPFKFISFDNIMYRSILKYLCDNFLVSDESEKNWSICCISDDNFLLNNGEVSPLNNMPLGDTIYVIGKPERPPYQGLSQSGAEKIAREIANWRNYVYDLKKTMGNDLKIRVIIFPCKSFQEAYEEKDALKTLLTELISQFTNGEINSDEFIHLSYEITKEMSDETAQKAFVDAQQDIDSKDMRRRKILTPSFEKG